MGLKEFQRENNELLNFILDERFFKSWKQEPMLVQSKSGLNISDDEIGMAKSSGLELYLTSYCNQKCEYCYLQKYENELYPPEYNKQELILHNLKVVLQWILDNDYFIRNIDLFTGEIWHTQFGLDVLDTILEYLDKGMRAQGFIIPSNMSFIFDEDQICKIQNRIDDAYEKYRVKFCFSASVDGKYCEDGRPLKNGKVRDDAFYERLFLFCQHNNFLFHPMISANNVKHWKENYDWWKEKCKEYNFIFRKAVMALEVRNDEWGEEALKDYADFVDYYLEDYYQNVCDSDDITFAKHCFPSADRYIEANGHLSPCLPGGYSYHGCTVSDTLCVRVGDLAIFPCHRTAYDKFNYGYFKVENDKIVGIRSANNVHMAMKVLLMNNTNTTVECDICKYARYCQKGCYGAQYEYSKDPFIPVKSVCDLYHTKIDKKIEIYERHRVIDYIKNINEYDEEWELVQEFLKFYEDIQKKEDIYAKVG